MLVTQMCNKINWPKNLIEELAHRRCILFLGSGISATSKNDEGKAPPTWGEFLENIKSLKSDMSTDDRSFIEEMLKQKNYMMALQAIYNLSDTGEYDKYLKDTYLRAGYLPSEVHKAIKEIDSKIVITTNFDKIYDQLCNDHAYGIFDYKEAKSIITNIKSPEHIIVKAHGNIDDTNGIIFTTKQYFQVQSEHPDFYCLLRALFLTHTIVFLGYGLNDPDINLVLQSLNNTSNPTAPHYIVLKKGTSGHLKALWRESYNISVIEYGPNYSNLDQNIMDLRDEVLTFRSDRNMP